MSRIRGTRSRPRVLIIVQNLPVPFDRRVWLECQTLTGAGYEVTVICPAGEGTWEERVLDGVRIVPYRAYAPGGSAVDFALEYAHSFLATARIALKQRRTGAFDVVQACNPPDIFWPLARWLRRRDGSRFVFDHHDLCPELYESRFADGPRVLHRALLRLERETFRAADRVASTNESYAAVATGRGAVPQESVTVVRTGPDPNRLRRREATPELRRRREHLVAYLGVMGPQDGVDIALSAADIIVNSMGRRDISFTFMGAGDCHADLVTERNRLGLQDFVEMPGRVPDETVAEVLSTADVGLSPDPLNPLNDVSTMNKTMEYMSFGLPVVAFDLTETRVSAQDAARYVEPNDVTAYARAVVDLLDDAPARTAMGRRGRELVEEHLAWQHQQVGYLALYDELVGRVGPGRVRELPLRTSTRAPETSASGTPKTSDTSETSGTSETSTARPPVGHLAATEA
ncbi:MAG TPA: glycosyltransferase family 4 protein [Intrasporangium sp.]|uniref:glycosyltransferase family 4 protein n=1 Tax=Intrasporangium sp. TaxID=1925024 RepID=UPI002B483D60|nr:glycosyltransferase family 4 protein [Intrasporangium sp.]HKX66718.1 glycosyltransferase family 4 protein [Intrasporangium sp.]